MLCHRSEISNRCTNLVTASRSNDLPYQKEHWKIPFREESIPLSIVLKIFYVEQKEEETEKKRMNSKREGKKKKRKCVVFAFPRT